MHEVAERLAGPLVRADEALAREFEARLADSSALAFRVAYSVLRQKQDAEDVAQEAFLQGAPLLQSVAGPRCLPQLAGADDVPAGDRSEAQRSTPRDS